MKKPVLVIMAAGMGSRYGGLKQLDPVDDDGNMIIDYSLYDAKQAGFETVIFLIRPGMKAAFHTAIGCRIAREMEVLYAYQQIESLPVGFSVPEGREKPWGTGHAVLSCASLIHGPFAVINADDYYGPHAFRMLYRFLSSKVDARHYAMVGYKLQNTLAETGSVARGICTIESDGYLMGITEHTRIERRGSQVAFTEDGGISWKTLPENAVTSMNFWGFPQTFLHVLAEQFPVFLQEHLAQNPLKCEYFLPAAVDAQIRKGKASVLVLPSQDRWYGVTYREDKPVVERAFRQMKADGVYPQVLWR